jgi:hypothetical protein
MLTIVIRIAINVASFIVRLIASICFAIGMNIIVLNVFGLIELAVSHFKKNAVKDENP